MKITKGKICKCKLFGGYTVGYICRICKKPIYTSEQAAKVDRLREGGEEKMPDTFRKEYTPLDDEQKEKMEAIKVKAQELLDLFDSTVSPEERSDRSRCMAVARTNLETTIMWAVKGVTSEKTNQR